MNITGPIWEAAYYEIEQAKETYLKRILSGNCTEKEYAANCGFLQGINFFEEQLRQARNPKQKDMDSAREED